MRLSPSRSPLASLGSFAALALALSACADPLAPAIDAGVSPVAAVGTNVSQPLQQTFGTGMEQAAGRDTRIDVNSGPGGTFIDAYVLSKNIRWHDPIAGTSWIGPQANANNFYSVPTENDIYRTTFNLPAGATSPILNISLWSDNAATVFVNGQQIGQQPQSDVYTNYGCADPTPANTCAVFSTTPFLYTTSGEPVVWNIGGSNTLQIVVLNAEFKQGCQNVPVVTPECASASGLDFLAEVRYGLTVGNQGCTPGYWKQSQHFDSWVTYTTSTNLNTLFTGAPSITMIDALQGGGGPGLAGARSILLRAAAAALLNASSSGVAYPMTFAQIDAAVEAALASGSRDTMLATAADLDAKNNLGCPLN